MDLDVRAQKTDLREAALELFSRGLADADTKNAIFRAVRLKDGKIWVVDQVLDLSDFSGIYVISFGKAGMAMAAGLDAVLKDKLTAGIVSAPQSDISLPSRWEVFHGGHPLPNEASFATARAAIELLKKADAEKALVIFLISGGGSAMLDLPRDEDVSLPDLHEANKVLVTCGATIGEVNAIRRCLSKIKGGGLSQIAANTTQISLIISDTNPGEDANVASGPTIGPPMPGNSPQDVARIVEKYRLKDSLPKSVLRSIKRSFESPTLRPASEIEHSVYTLLDNKGIIETIAKEAESRGFAVEIADDLVEAPIKDGCRELASRFLELRRRVNGKPIVLISGGEFACPVRGVGVGGRNLEATLRMVCEVEDLDLHGVDFIVLNAGTDGIDGNSPAAGAVADQDTLKRSRELGLDAGEYLENSDAFTFFAALDDVITTGPTGTNVRDVRMLLAN
jgi:hydroxypyruvate reductase